MKRVPSSLSDELHAVIKLNEELGELTKEASKALALLCVNKPIPEPLRQKLTLEVADVLAASEVLIEELRLDRQDITPRIKLKIRRARSRKARRNHEDSQA